MISNAESWEGAEECQVDVATCVRWSPTASLSVQYRWQGGVSRPPSKLNGNGLTKKLSQFGNPVPPVERCHTGDGNDHDATIYHGRIMLTMRAPEIKALKTGNKSKVWQTVL